MVNMGKRWFFEVEAGGDKGGGGGDQQTGGDKGGQQAPFADAAAARTFLKDWVPSEDYVKPFDDAKVLPFATHLKTKVDGFSKTFPEKWRDLIAGDKPERLKTLERFQTPVAVFDAYEAIRQKMSSGELKPSTPFPEKGTDVEKATWRATNGIPEAADGYKFKMPENYEQAEPEHVRKDDATILASLSASMHKAHVPAPIAQGVADWFFAERGARAAKRAEMDASHKAAAEDKLRASWGPDFRANQARVGAFLAMFPEGVAEQIVNARLADGTRIGDSPELNDLFAGFHRQLVPGGLLLPAGHGDMGQSIEEELKKYDGWMRAGIGTQEGDKYWRDEKVQARYRELITAKEQLSQRKAA